MKQQYIRGKIYELVCKETGERYIGSTIQKYLCQRLATHVFDYKDWKSGRGNYISCFPIIERGNYDLNLIENFECENRAELLRREGQHIREKECVNKQIAGRTQAEYYQDNKEKKKEQRIEYYKHHADELKQYQKVYYINNLEAIQNRNREYYKKNYDKIQQICGEKIDCECGAKVTRNNMWRHKETPKHFKNMEQQEIKKSNGVF